MDMFFIEMLGFIAGATTLVSSVPQLIANLRDKELARGQSLFRNLLQAIGNALWFLYGASVGSTSMVTFAGLGCFMAICLALQTYRVHHSGFGSKNSPFSSRSGFSAA